MTIWAPRNVQKIAPFVLCSFDKLPAPLHRENSEFTKYCTRQVRKSPERNASTCQSDAQKLVTYDVSEGFAAM
jgi:hypothetical protein